MDGRRRHASTEHSEQVQLVRELWLLRERARVQAAERHFLADLTRVLDRALPARRVRGFATETSSVESGSGDASSARPEGDTRSAPQSVFESFPPPRDSSAPARELPNEHSMRDVELARAQHRVTNLCPEFRALLEGHAREEGSPRRDSSWGELLDTRAVSTALSSAFRHELEGVLVRRDAHRQNGRVYHRVRGTSGALSDDEDLDEHLDMVSGARRPARRSSPALERAVNLLRQDVNVLKNVINASFDIQLDIQRAVRQEVAAAMHAGSSGLQEVSACTDCDDSPEGNTAQMSVPALRDSAERKVTTFEHGTCAVCLTASVDSLLYACGHMCTCAHCGRQLIASGHPCPVCRAPVRDVVRAYTVAN